MLGITEKLGVLLYHFLTGRIHFVKLQGVISFGIPVISGVPQGTVLCFNIPQDPSRVLCGRKYWAHFFI